MKHNKFELFSRGGDVKRHELNLLLVNAGAVAAPGLLAGAAAYVASAYVTTGAAWTLYWTYNVARVADTIGLGRFPLLSIRGYAPSSLVSTFHDVYHATFTLTTPIAIAVAAACAYVAGRKVFQVFMKRSATFKDEHLRGVQLQTKEELIAKVGAEWVKEEAKAEAVGYPLAHRFSIAGVPIPPKMVQRNIVCTGGTGSGKSVAIFDLADQVAAAGRTMIVYDKVTEFATYYYRDGIDIIFNPFDERFPGWCVFSEVTLTYEFDQMANYLIPKGKDSTETGDYFKTSARTIFACIMQKLYEEGKGTNEALCKAIFETGQEDLYLWLKGTAAESLLNPESKGTGGGGMLSTLTEAVKVLRYVKSGPFSLKKFIREAGDRRIFITSKEEVHSIVTPLTSMAMSILYTSVMSGEIVKTDKFWFFLDEMASLEKLPIFSTAVTEARKFGAVAVVGVQNTSQLTAMFGKDHSKTILSNLQNQLLLRVSDEETQEAYSKMIGAGEFDEQSENIGWGAATSKDSAGVSTARKERRAVLASEIKLLSDCTGYLQLAGNYDIAEVEYTSCCRDRAVIAKGWMPRNLDLPVYVPAVEKEAVEVVDPDTGEIIEVMPDAGPVVPAAARGGRVKRKLGV